MSIKNFDILIIGGGHAGSESAWAATQFDLRVGLISMANVPLASAPCNPAVGGVGKGQVVRELDALGGLMPLLTDFAGIQFRTLNESKGAAVRSTRVQIDKDLYSVRAEQLLSKREGLEIIRARISSISVCDDNSFEIVDDIKNIYHSKVVIVTTGTFLSGKLHTGEDQNIGGRVDCQASVPLASLVRTMGKVKRFKTGTPPRLHRDSIDFTVMDRQESDPCSAHFHFENYNKPRFQKQLTCYLTRTNVDTLTIIRKNKERSPIFNGQIKGIGPRYCPSVEDKAFRYPDKHEHHVFVEPEGLNLDTFYPNGISSSLPVDIQKEFVQTMAGLENAEIVVPGYAVEYDVVDTTELNLSLEHKSIQNLFFAGQLNGTSGYEEAAGQGFVAGINGAMSILGRNRFVLDRASSYIGVMIEDLVTCERDEPYRLFTARSESRLFNREDNTYYRIAPFRKLLELSQPIDEFLAAYLLERDLLISLVKSNGFRATKKWQAYFIKMGYGKIQENITLEELIKRTHLDPEITLKVELDRMGLDFISQLIPDVANSLKYEGYLTRSSAQTTKMQKLNNKNIRWEELSVCENISHECRQRIIKIRPETFQQLSKMNGIRPATLAYVASSVL